jgi:hypothetical protein
MAPPKHGLARFLSWILRLILTKSAALHRLALVWDHCGADNPLVGRPVRAWVRMGVHVPVHGRVPGRAWACLGCLGVYMGVPRRMPGLPAK